MIPFTRATHFGYLFLTHSQIRPKKGRIFRRKSGDRVPIRVAMFRGHGPHRAAAVPALRALRGALGRGLRRRGRGQDLLRRAGGWAAAPGTGGESGKRRCYPFLGHTERRKAELAEFAEEVLVLFFFPFFSGEGEFADES